jgi:hypothetical protein
MVKLKSTDSERSDLGDGNPQEGFKIDTALVLRLIVTMKGVASIVKEPLGEVLLGLNIADNARFS